MNGVDAIRSAFRAAYGWFDGTLADVTEEQARYRPAGLAHPIGALAAHAVQAEDWGINQLLRGRNSVWDEGGWEQKLGLPNVMQLQQDAEVELEGGPSALKPYIEAVRASTEEYLAGLSDEDLDRELDMSGFGMDSMRAGDVMTTFLIGNTLAHTGEISTVKGLQGAKGYPF